MTPDDVDTWKVFSVLGYSLLPINGLAVVAIVFSLQGYLGFVLSAVAILWATAASTRIIERTCDMREQRWLVAYPTMLLYSCFVMITVF